jgi:hypothetical protein
LIPVAVKRKVNCKEPETYLKSIVQEMRRHLPTVEAQEMRCYLPNAEAQETRRYLPTVEAQVSSRLIS